MKNHNAIAFGIADDDPSFRKAVVSTLCVSTDVATVFCCDNGLDLIKNTIKYKPSVILVDLYMPVVSGLEAIKKIRKKYDQIKILAISSLFQQDVVQELKRANVDGYCARSTADIKATFLRILNGEKFYDLEYFDHWIRRAEEITTKNVNCNFDLSSIEIDILRYSSEGDTNKEIADKLNLSHRTIDHYLNRLVHKLNLRSKNELVRFSFENGFCTVNCENNAMGMCHTNSIFSPSSFKY